MTITSATTRPLFLEEHDALWPVAHDTLQGKAPTTASLQQFYSSFTVDPVSAGQLRRTQKGLGKRISNLH
jgi:hypothetical protein